MRVTITIKKLIIRRNTFLRIITFVTRSIIQNLYYSLVSFGHLLYSIQVWGFAFGTNLNRLTVLQKKIVRMMTYNDKPYGYRGPLTHSDPLFKELKILKIKDIFELQSIRFIHDTITGISPLQFQSWFTLISDIHDHATRNNAEINTLNTEVDLTCNLFVPHARTTYYYGVRSIKVFGTME